MTCNVVSAVDPSTGTCSVEFRLAADVPVEKAWLAGEFNDWSTDGVPLERDADGSLVAVVSLRAGESYRFRYYLGNGRWENDWAADDYVDNPHGGSDSVVVVTAPTAALPRTAGVGRRPTGLLPPARTPPPRT